MKKTKVKITSVLFFVILFLVIINVYKIIHGTVNANSQDVILENNNYIRTGFEEKINLNDIINKNNKEIEQEITTEQTDLEYTTEYTENNNVPKGEFIVIQQGIDGKREVYTRNVYENGERVLEEIIGSKVIKASVDKIVEIGTSEEMYFSKIKIGEEAYVTPTTLIMRKEPNKDSEKIRVLRKDDKVIIKEMAENWCLIEYNEIMGWVEKDCIKGKIEKKQSQNNNIVSKQSESFKKSIPLNKPSGFSEEQFKQIFENESKDSNKVFKNNAKYFYFIEQQYNINGLFVAAVAIHESNWATSKIAIDKKNLFGYGAYDRSPYESAYSFENEAEGIDLLARVFVKYYLNPSGTKIYEGNIASGKYYNGNTIEAVGKKYASDSKWTEGICKWMNYLYEKI